jgi:uncharacterized protein DUF6636
MSRRAVLLLVIGAVVVAGVGGALIGTTVLGRGERAMPPPSVIPTPSPSVSPTAEPTPTITAITPSLTSDTFVMPSGNIGCGFFDALRCDIRSGLNPTPSGTCDLDWTGLTLEVSGGAAPQCAGDTVVDPGAPVLQYGETWSRAGIICESRRTGLECINSDEHGFLLSRASWNAF